MFVIAAILCSGADCMPASAIVKPSRFELLGDWCERYAERHVEDMARGFIPRTVLTVQPDSIQCHEAS